MVGYFDTLQSMNPFKAYKEKKVKNKIVDLPLGQSPEDRKAEGDAFIQQREKIAGKLMEGGASYKSAVKDATKIISGMDIGTSAQKLVSDVQSEKEGAARELENLGAFEEVTPKESQLLPTEPSLLEKSIPFFGRSLAALATTRNIAELTGGSAEGLGFGGVSEGEAQQAFPALDNATARELLLNQIRQESFKKGISLHESIGSLTESIPVVGSLVSKYASDLIEDPSGNAANVIGEINKVKEAASTGQEKVRNGLENPEYGLTRARQMEEEIARLEGRMKLLVLSSPILRANSDQVNLIQEQILESQEKISRYKQAASIGLAAQITQTGRIVPTDEKMLLELKRYSERG